MKPASTTMGVPSPGTPMVVLVLLLAATATTGQTASAASKQCQLSSDSSTLSCHLRTLQSDMDATRQQVSDVRHLRIRCSDVFFFESQLKSEHFGHLPQLQELDVSYCKIRHLPARAFAGLSGLRKLSVQSHNSEWTSILMDVDPDGFQKLDSLRELNLANNNLWSLPAGTFCNLPSLAAVNLTSNHLLDADDLGLSSSSKAGDDEVTAACGQVTSLTDLDLSNNRIASIKAGDFDRAPNLKRLNLRGNRLAHMEDEALKAMPDLEEVNLADNELAALPPTVFSGSRNLRVLMLQNNSLTLLTSQLLSGLTNLTVLNLSHNSISSHLLSADTFASLKNLIALDLSHNRLTQVEELTFGALASLQILNLANNRIQTISERSLGLNVMLQSLTLSHNAIRQLGAETFAGQSMLAMLAVDHNLLESLELNTTSLQDVFLSHNRLAAVPRFLRDCRMLTTLDLGENLIGDIAPGDLSGFESLYGLRLAGNNIQHLSNTSFANVSKVQVLNLADNKVEAVEQGTFAGLQDLRALRLDGNSLRDINGIVSSLSQLEWLNVSSNRLEWFDYAFIPNSLQWLDLSFNQVTSLDNFYGLQNFKIHTLDASSNLIARIGEASFPFTLARIFLNQNRISVVEPNSFSRLQDLLTVELTDNLLETLQPSALNTKFYSSEDGEEQLASISIRGNPFVCDCHLGWLRTINNNDEVADDLGDNGNNRGVKGNFHMRVADLEAVTCTKPSDGGGARFPGEVSLVTQVEEDEFLCSYQTHCFDLCLCCDFYACDCRMQCPHGCQCSHDASWTRNVITCSSRNHSSVPLLIPMDATHVRLDGNDLRHVDQQNFLGRQRVQELYLNSSNIRSLGNNTFSGLAHGLLSLHLEDNDLTQVAGNEFSSLVRLEELYLQNNAIIYINEFAFDALRSLRILRLDGNLLTVFPVWSLTASAPGHGVSRQPLTSISLSRNTWSCGCEFVTRFNDFLEANIDVIQDYELIQCVSSNDMVAEAEEGCFGSAGIKSANGQKNALTTMIATSGNGSDSGDGLSLATVLVPVLVAVVVLVVGLLAVCVFRKTIKNWLYEKSSCSSFYDSNAPSSVSSSSGGVDSSSAATTANRGSATTKLFDVYINYCNQDSEFVDSTLAPTLEHGVSGVNNTMAGGGLAAGVTCGGPVSYRVCLQGRDFPKNTPIHEAVAVATESSARVLVVLSRNYLNYEWGRVRGALDAALAGSPDKLVILFIEDLTPEELRADPQLAHYVKMCATVKWGSPGFLSKLRFFLPEPVFLTFQRNITLRALRNGDSSNNGYCRTGSESGAGFSHSAITQPTYDDHMYHSIGHGVGHSDDINHIYHTLEPGLVAASQGRHQRPQPAHCDQKQQQHLQMQMQTAGLLQPSFFSGQNGQQQQPESNNSLLATSVFLNRNLELVLKVDPPKDSLSPVMPMVCHSYSQSTSSGQHLLPVVTAASTQGKDRDEYIV